MCLETHKVLKIQYSLLKGMTPTAALLQILWSAFHWIFFGQKISRNQHKRDEEQAKLQKVADMQTHACAFFLMRICAKFAILNAKQDKQALFHDVGTIGHFFKRFHMFKGMSSPFLCAKFSVRKFGLRKRISFQKAWEQVKHSFYYGLIPNEDFFNKYEKYVKSSIPEGTGRYVGLLLAPAEGLSVWSRPIPAYSSLIQPIPTYSNLFQPVSASSSLFWPIPANSGLFQPIQAYSSLFRPISAYSAYSKLFQPIPAYISLFQSVSSYFILFQPIPAYSTVFQPFSAYFRLIQPFPTNTCLFQPLQPPIHPFTKPTLWYWIVVANAPASSQKPDVTDGWTE